MEFGELKLVRESEIPEEETSFPFPDLSKEKVPSLGRNERGVTAAAVRKLMASISEHKLDLGSCILKGGAWRVAAFQIMGILPGGKSPGAVIERALHDFSKELDEIPILSTLAQQSFEWRNTLEKIREALKDTTRGIRSNKILLELYEALIADDEDEEESFKFQGLKLSE